MFLATGLDPLRVSLTDAKSTPVFQARQPLYLPARPHETQSVSAAFSTFKKLLVSPPIANRANHRGVGLAKRK